jgi:KDO2-lipid IV(A) lauroyltransferase
MISSALARALLLLASILPPRGARALAAGIGRAVYLVPAARRGLLANARHILGPGSTPRERRRLAVAVLAHFGRAIADLILGPRLWAGAGPRVEVEGAEHFAALARAGRGFLAVTLHMGSYEVGGMLVAQLGQRALVVYHRDPASFFDRLRSRQRRRFPLEEIAIDRSPFFAVPLLRHLESGGVVLMAGELAAAARGAPYGFLDGQARFSPWPARLAAAAGAPILPVFTLREGEGYRVCIEAPIRVETEGEEAAAMRRLVAIFEGYVRRHPEQWLMVRPFWVEQGEAREPVPSPGPRESNAAAAI